MTFKKNNEMNIIGYNCKNDRLSKKQTNKNLSIFMSCKPALISIMHFPVIALSNHVV